MRSASEPFSMLESDVADDAQKMCGGIKSELRNRSGSCAGAAALGGLELTLEVT